MIYDQKEIISIFVKKTLPFIAVVYMLLLLTTNKNLFTINLIILTPLLVSKLFVAIKNKEQPSINEWCKSGLKTIATISLLYLFINWMGAYGLLGFILVILLLAAWRIYKSWELFMGGMRSIEMRIFGRTLDRKKKNDMERERE